MSYTEHTWVDGETITAAKMNNIEEGIAEAAQSGGGGAVIINDNGTSLDKTYAEIYNLMASGAPCYIKYVYGENPDLDETYDYAISLLPIVKIYKYDDTYRIYASSANQIGVSSSAYSGAPSLYVYSVDSSDDYPVFYRTSKVNGSSMEAFITRS